MANSLISMIKGGNTLINNTEVLDGQVLFNTDEKTILLDDNNTRTKYCGADKSNKNLAPIENGNTATRGYAAGSYVVWKEQLYKVLTQINSGTAFVVGTNIALDTVGAELTQINSDLAKHEIGVPFSITVSEGGSEDFVAPSDGYIRLAPQSMLGIYRADSPTASSAIIINRGTNAIMTSMYIRKGTKINITNDVGSGVTSYVFFPYV